MAYADVSASATFSTPQTLSSPTYFSFGKGNVFSPGKVETSPENQASATSALGNASSATGTGKGLSTGAWIGISVGILAVAIVLGIYIFKRKG